MSAGQLLTAVQCILTAIIIQKIPQTLTSDSCQRMIAAIADSTGADVWDN